MQQTTQLKSKWKIWTDTSPEKKYKDQISIWKCAQYHMFLGNCKLKQQRGIITHLLDD